MRYIFTLLLLFAAPPSAALADIFSYTDESGAVHYVDSESKIPEQYRKTSTNKSKSMPPISKVPAGSFVPRSAGSNSAYGGANKKVEVFRAEWCPYCRKLEAFLTEKKIGFTRLDIDKSSRAKRLYRELGGGGIPITRIGGQKVIRGYSPGAVLRALGRK